MKPEFTENGGIPMLRKAGREARLFVESVRGQNGRYRIDRWPEISARRTVRDVDSAIVGLRVAQRLSMGFLDPVDDALYLLAGLRSLGVPASFHLGREIVPVAAPAGYYAWVQHGTEVVSTSLPVKETYLEIHRNEKGGARC